MLAKAVAATGQACYRQPVFGIGPTEFIIIGVIALMLFSPRELPKILRSAAKFWGSLRNTADEFRDAIMNEEEMQDIRGALKGGISSFKSAESAARRELMKARMEMQKAQNKLLKTVKAAEEAKREELAPTAVAAGEPPAASGSESPALSASSEAVEAPSSAVAVPDASEVTGAQAVAQAASAASVAMSAAVAASEVHAPVGAVPSGRPNPGAGQGAA